MPLFSQPVFAGCALSGAFFLMSLYLYFIQDRKRLAIGALLCSAFIVRLVMIHLDPYLHEWDERFHALVAKNMIGAPFRPMLFKTPVLPYDPQDWSSNHIWLHKQPLFLWQMAASMAVLGKSLFAMRLPSALLGTLAVWMTYDMAKRWTRRPDIAYGAAVLSTFAYYTLEMTSGRLLLDHNDLAFYAYTTGACWAFTRYIHGSYAVKWALLTGVMAGLAVLTKWLTGLLIFGGWGIYLALTLRQTSWRRYADFLIALALAGLVFLPWQFYILNTFPLEANLEYAHNAAHFREDFGHPGSVFFHLQHMSALYHPVLILLLVAGCIFRRRTITFHTPFSIAMAGMAVTIYLFFSVLVATKMPAYTYPVAAILQVIMSVGWFTLPDILFARYITGEKKRKWCRMVSLCCLALFSAKAFTIVDRRSDERMGRNNAMYNAEVYASLPDSVARQYIILNCRPFDHIALMFYKDATAYAWYPEATVLDSLKREGYRFAAFDYADDDPQSLPEWIRSDTAIYIPEGRPK